MFSLFLIGMSLVKCICREIDICFDFYIFIYSLGYSLHIKIVCFSFNCTRMFGFIILFAYESSLDLEGLVHAGMFPVKSGESSKLRTIKGPEAES